MCGFQWSDGSNCLCFFSFVLGNMETILICMKWTIHRWIIHYQIIFISDTQSAKHLDNFKVTSSNETSTDQKQLGCRIIEEIKVVYVYCIFTKLNENMFFYFNGDIKRVTLSASTYFSHIFQFHNTLRKHVTQLKFRRFLEKFHLKSFEKQNSIEFRRTLDICGI